MKESLIDISLDSEAVQSELHQFFVSKNQGFFERGNFSTYQTMAKGHPTKWPIHHLLMFVVIINKFPLKM